MVAQRLNWIDWSKAILIYLVVLAHYGHISPIVDNLICSFHMPAFFMISGYLHKPVEPKHSIPRNFKRLIVPAFLFSLLCWGYNSVMMFLRHIPFSWDVYVYKPLIGMISYDDPYVSSPCCVIWFLQVLFICQVLLDILVVKGNKTLLLSLSFICIILTEVWYNMGINNTNYLFFVQRTCVGFPFLFIGFMLREKQYFRCLSSHNWILVASAILYVVGVSYNGRVGIFSYRFGHSAFLFFLIAALGCACFFSIIKKIKFGGGNLLLVISNGTIVILCLHRLMIPFFIYFHINPYVGSLLIIGICYPIILFFNKRLPWFIGSFNKQVK